MTKTIREYVLEIFELILIPIFIKKKFLKNLYRDRIFFWGGGVVSLTILFLSKSFSYG